MFWDFCLSQFKTNNKINFSFREKRFSLISSSFNLLWNFFLCHFVRMTFIMLQEIWNIRRPSGRPSAPHPRTWRVCCSFRSWRCCRRRGWRPSSPRPKLAGSPNQLVKLSVSSTWKRRKINSSMKYDKNDFSEMVFYFIKFEPFCMISWVWLIYFLRLNKNDLWVKIFYKE